MASLKIKAGSNVDELKELITLADKQIATLLETIAKINEFKLNVEFDLAND